MRIVNDKTIHIHFIELSKKPKHINWHATTTLQVIQRVQWSITTATQFNMAPDLRCNTGPSTYSDSSIISERKVSSNPVHVGFFVRYQSTCEIAQVLRTHLYQHQAQFNLVLLLLFSHRVKHNGDVFSQILVFWHLTTVCASTRCNQSNYATTTRSQQSGYQNKQSVEDIKFTQLSLKPGDVKVN